VTQDSHIGALVRAVRSPVTWLRTHFAKLMRYAAVSVVSTITSLTVLGVLVGVLSAPAGWANVIATTVATVPSFELNRRWVWTRRGDRSFLREVAPFAALSFTGLVISTLNVHLVGLWATSADWGRLLRTVAIEVTNVGTFGCLWLFQYVLCDRFLFRSAGSHALAPSLMEPVGLADTMAVAAEGPMPEAQAGEVGPAGAGERLDEAAVSHRSPSLPPR
jgi:putative flippase GtrA